MSFHALLSSPACLPDTFTPSPTLVLARLPDVLSCCASLLCPRFSTAACAPPWILPFASRAHSALPGGA
eukprot:11192368-Lingulodinium_polyedra.AAC.1